MPSVHWNDLFGFISQLMNENAPFFEDMGLRMFKGFAVIMIAWFGIQSALSSAGGGSGFRFDRFVRLLITIAFGLGMITYYSHPIPGFNRSFHQIITDQGRYMADQMDRAVIQSLTDRLNTIYLGLEQPGISWAFNAMEGVRYVVTFITIALAQSSTFAVIAFGYVAQAVAVLLGPVFLPFFIVPQMEWLFWGWLKSLIQYVFYPVVANAYVFVFGSLMLRFFDSHPPPWDGAMMMLLLYPFLLILIAFTYGIVKIPSLVNSIFTGGSGQSAMPKH